MRHCDNDKQLRCHSLLLMRGQIWQECENGGKEENKSKLDGGRKGNVSEKMWIIAECEWQHHCHIPDSGQLTLIHLSWLCTKKISKQFSSSVITQQRLLSHCLIHLRDAHSSSVLTSSLHSRLITRRNFLRQTDSFTQQLGVKTCSNPMHYSLNNWVNTAKIS